MALQLQLKLLHPSFKFWCAGLLQSAWRAYFAIPALQSGRISFLWWLLIDQNSVGSEVQKKTRMNIANLADHGDLSEDFPRLVELFEKSLLSCENSRHWNWNSVPFPPLTDFYGSHRPHDLPSDELLWDHEYMIFFFKPWSAFEENQE